MSGLSFSSPLSHISLSRSLSPSGDSGRPESSSLCALRPATPPVLSRRRCRRRIDRCRLPVCSSTSATALVAFRRRTVRLCCYISMLKYIYIYLENGVERSHWEKRSSIFVDIFFYIDEPDRVAVVDDAHAKK